MARKTKVLIVDDSKIFRSILVAAFSGQEDMEITGQAENGRQALDLIRQNRPDVVTLDLEMPEMDGLATLRQIIRINETLPPQEQMGVVMVSSLTQKGAEVTVQALQAGAFDFVTKPEGTPETSLESLRHQLLTKTRFYNSQRIAARSRAMAAARPVPAPAPRPQAVRRPAAGPRPRAILIGVSTGGPRALTSMLPALCEKTDLPLLIVQHMPPNFTESLAKSLDAKCRHTVTEAREGQAIERGHAYIAPGGWHMVVSRAADGREVLSLNTNPPENGCRPAVDVLFRSAAAILGGAVLAVVLTGMGNDGAKGIGPLKRAGARIMAQDEESSVVWGMPGSAVATGLVDDVLPLMAMPEAIGQILNRSSGEWN